MNTIEESCTRLTQHIRQLATAAAQSQMEMRRQPGRAETGMKAYSDGGEEFDRLAMVLAEPALQEIERIRAAGAS